MKVPLRERNGPPWARNLASMAVRTRLWMPIRSQGSSSQPITLKFKEESANSGRTPRVEGWNALLAARHGLGKQAHHQVHIAAVGHATLTRMRMALSPCVKFTTASSPPSSWATR